MSPVEEWLLGLHCILGDAALLILCMYVEWLFEKLHPALPVNFFEKLGFFADTINA